MGPKIKHTTSIKPCISTALYLLLKSSVGTYVGLYKSGMFYFGAYVNLQYLYHPKFVCNVLGF